MTNRGIQRVCARGEHKRALKRALHALAHRQRCKTTRTHLDCLLWNPSVMAFGGCTCYKHTTIQRHDAISFIEAWHRIAERDKTSPRDPGPQLTSWEGRRRLAGNP